MREKEGLFHPNNDQRAVIAQLPGLFVSAKISCTHNQQTKIGCEPETEISTHCSEHARGQEHSPSTCVHESLIAQGLLEITELQ